MLCALGLSWTCSVMWRTCISSAAIVLQDIFPLRTSSRCHQFSWQRRHRILVWGGSVFVARPSTDGGTMPFAAEEEATVFSAITPSATLFAPPLLSLPPSHLNLKNLASCFPLGPPTPVAFPMTPVVHRLSSLVVVVAALPTCGFLADLLGLLMLGTSPSLPSSARLPPPPPPLLWRMCSTRLSPARTPFWTPPLRWPPWAPLSVRWSWRPAEEGGPLPCVKSSLGFPRSRALCTAWLATLRGTSA